MGYTLTHEGIWKINKLLTTTYRAGLSFFLRVLTLLLDVQILPCTQLGVQTLNDGYLLSPLTLGCPLTHEDTWKINKLLTTTYRARLSFFLRVLTLQLDVQKLRTSWMSKNSASKNSALCR